MLRFLLEFKSKNPSSWGPSRLGVGTCPKVPVEDTAEAEGKKGARISMAVLGSSDGGLRSVFEELRKALEAKARTSG